MGEFRNEVPSKGIVSFDKVFHTTWRHVLAISYYVTFVHNELWENQIQDGKNLCSISKFTIFTTKSHCPRYRHIFHTVEIPFTSERAKTIPST